MSDERNQYSNCLLLLLSRKPLITKNPAVKQCNGDEVHTCMSGNREDEYTIVAFSSVPLLLHTSPQYKRGFPNIF